ncbi:MAG: hypothetical protein EOO77_23235 [Oxalobacteraceae bacterium]|nr:MAG: hypothetical protein EOO77_23235 [Oxalobacteraceae bacterium]
MVRASAQNNSFEEAVSDFSADKIDFIDADARGAFSSANQSEPRSITLERGFACAIAVGLAFWFVVAYLVWGR